MKGLALPAIKNVFKKYQFRGFPGSIVVGSPPANAGDVD